VDAEEVVDVASKVVIAAGLVLIMVTAALGGGNENGKVAVHVLAYDSGRACHRKFPVIWACHDIITTYEGCGDIDFFPVFFNLLEYRGFDYAVEWPGGYSCVFTDCSYGHLGEIRWSGDWISQVWSECQHYSVAIPGWGWITVGDPGMICVVPNPLSGEVSMCDCGDGPDCDYLDYPNASYCAGICGAIGHNPCLPKTHATTAATWGSIKSLFD
jgi:hypothetical protein